MRNANVIPSLFLDFMQMQEFAKDPLIFTEARGSRLTRQRWLPAGYREGNDWR